MTKPVIYTAVFGEGSGPLYDPQSFSRDCDYICFTDQQTLKSSVFKIALEERSENPRIRAKEYKLQPHKFLKGYQVSLWVDASIEIIGTDIYQFIKQHQANKFELFRTPDRNTIVEEVEYCKALKKEDPTILKKQYEAYRVEGFKDHIGLAKGGVLLRKHNERDNMAFDNAWWGENVKFSTRDEVSFPYVVWKFGWKEGENYSFFPYDIRNNPFVKVHKSIL